MLKRRLRQLWRYSQGLIGLGGDDALLASYPRSGSTWVRFFLCNLISLREMEGRTVGFALLDATMPELGVDDLRRQWLYSTIPRVVKTHRPYSPMLSGAGGRILVIRDPRDAMVSLYWYEKGRRRPRFQGELSAFLHNRRFGLPAWFRHYDSWRSRAHIVLAYEDLRAAAHTEFGRLLDFLGVEEDSEVVNAAIERSRFRNVRQVEQTRGLADDKEFGSDFRFARKGKSGDWREHFSAEDQAYYAALHASSRIEIYRP